MKLVDVERFAKISQYSIPVINEDTWEEGYLECLHLIDSMPTIEAIPIEWIDHYIKRKVKIDGINEEVLYINDMLKSWENENEID